MDPLVLLARVATVACGAVVGAMLFSSPLLYVRHVRVLGSAGLLPSERTVTTNVVRIPPRTNLLRSSPRRIETTVCRLPWVASATVRRHLPDTVEIIVHPRRPVAVLATAAGPYELDARGFTIRQSVSPPPIPQITIAAPLTARAGAVVSDASAQAALAVARWTVGRTHGRVTKIVVDQAADLCLNTDDSVTVRLGQSDDLPEKLDRLNCIYTRDPGIATRVSEINLTYPKAPACTPRGVGQGVSASPAAGTASAGEERGSGGRHPDDEPTGDAQRAP